MNKNELNEKVLFEEGEIGKQRLKETIKAFTDEEKTETIKLIPSEKLWEELIRRNTSMMQKINETKEVLGVSADTISAISAKTWEDIQTRYNDVEYKFKQIAKVFKVAN